MYPPAICSSRSRDRRRTQHQERVAAGRAGSQARRAELPCRDRAGAMPARRGTNLRVALLELVVPVAHVSIPAATEVTSSGRRRRASVADASALPSRPRTSRRSNVPPSSGTGTLGTVDRLLLSSNPTTREGVALLRFPRSMSAAGCGATLRGAIGDLRGQRGPLLGAPAHMVTVRYVGRARCRSCALRDRSRFA